MFCPNCGKDCADFKFCPHCGGEMPTDTPKITDIKKSLTDIPTSSGYLGVDGSVVLSDSAVSICVNRLFKKYRTWIPYDQMVAVVYLRPSYKPRACGALLFRGENNKNVPIPDHRGITSDKCAITVSADTDTLFYHIFCMLKAVAPPTAKFEMIVPETDFEKLDTLAQRIDMDYFFRYAPLREKTVGAICAKHGIPQVVAKMLVDWEFDARQKEKYNADPMDAIRDLNLVVADVQNKQRRRNQVDAQRRKRQEQEAIRKSLERIETWMTLERLDDFVED